MRRRLLLSSLAIAVALVALLGIPLGLTASSLVRRAAVERLDREADLVEMALVTDGTAGSGSSVALDHYLRDAARVTLVAPGGMVVWEQQGVSLGRHVLRVERTLPNGAVVRVEADGSATRRKVLDVWAVITVTALVAAAIATALVVVQSRRLAAPLAALAVASNRLGAGDFRVDIPNFGLPEMDAVAAQLTRSSGRIAAMMTREREFSSNASHQLRTAITALRLHVEDLAAAGGQDERLSPLRGQLDRLERTVEDLLALARGTAVDAGLCDVRAVLHERVSAWRPVLAAASRDLELDASSSVPARGSAANIGQVIDILLDNALKHGSGTVTVSLGTARGTAIVSVGDEGRGIPQILAMGTLTRLDCALGTAGLMRQALSIALHHTGQRHAFGKPLIAQPLMKNVLADLALESEAATLLALRLALAVDCTENRHGNVAHETVMRRLLTPVAKFWVCKRGSHFAQETMECLGGNGYVEEGGQGIMARIYREMPLNSIWEGAGNIMAIDLLRALRKADAASALAEELAPAQGAHPALDRLAAALPTRVEAMATEMEARRLAQDVALAVQAALLYQSAPTEVFSAFCDSRIGGNWGHAFGTLAAQTDFDTILTRAQPR